MFATVESDLLAESFSTVANGNGPFCCTVFLKMKGKPYMPPKSEQDKYYERLNRNAEKAEEMEKERERERESLKGHEPSMLESFNHFFRRED